jgi:hypothetical protein
MTKRLVTTIALASALATAASASTALAVPPSDTPNNRPGVCNMLHVGGSAVGFAGMNNSAHGNGYVIMLYDLIIPAGCLG